MDISRILIKFSGEALGGSEGAGIDAEIIAGYAGEITKIMREGIQVAIVVGGGNIFRGAAGAKLGFERVHGDQMGMLATVINSIALSLALKDAGVPAEVYTATPMRPMAKYYVRDEALEFMLGGGVALIAGGTGNPYFTTDSAAALRACELHCDCLLKGTKVDGVYDKDPKKYPDAVRFETLTFAEAMERNLRVMDQTAFALCKENDMPLIVFNSTVENNTFDVIESLRMGKKLSKGTIVGNK
ncbi:MAG: UMP kinase [Bacteroidales bacterium]|jgi:uridylate kinase|nr:UMP kinase [Bacteroidales bacterium]MCI2121098.1 UMP kinase [Bacteroidales bacterium]MCI2144913.1 UMP kinase [Bacteroidales bacterium]